MPSAVNDFEIEPMLKSVAVVTGALASKSRSPYPLSSTILPSLINASTAPGTFYLDMRRSITASAVGKSGADSEAETVKTATKILTAHIASR
jgi:hypothetical protein